MNFDPQKFFIGLMDFFSILLPGGIVLAVLGIAVSHQFLRLLLGSTVLRNMRGACRPRLV